MNKDTKKKSKRAGQFDKFNEPRTIPGQWDVSGFHSMQKSSADHLSDDDNWTESSPTENEKDVKKSEPSGIKYLDPEYEDVQKTNRKWPTY